MNSLLQSVIYKILVGIKDWTLEELQFHKNNLELIEQELLRCQQEGADDIYVSSAQISISERSIILRSSPQIKRIISKPTTVLLALQHKFISEAKVAVITIEGNTFDLGVYDVGDGVIEELHLLSGDINGDYIQKLQEISRTTENIKCLIVASNDMIAQWSVNKIAGALNTCAQNYNNLHDLLVRGAVIYSGVLKGFFKDILLIQMLPSALYCETSNKERFELFSSQDKIISIPLLAKAKISSKSRKLFIKESGRNEPIAIIQLNNHSTENLMRHINIQTDINANYRIKFTITDLDSKGQHEIVI